MAVLEVVNILPRRHMASQGHRELHHSSDVIMGAMASQTPASPLFTQSFIQAKLKETSKLRVTGLYARNSPVTGEFPEQMDNNAENVSI